MIVIVNLHPNYLVLKAKYGKENIDYTKGFTGEMVKFFVSEVSNKGAT